MRVAFQFDFVIESILIVERNVMKHYSTVPNNPENTIGVGLISHIS